MKLIDEPGISLYFQVKQKIKENISNKIWLPGNKIPNEIDLVEYFGVSRSTIRQAILDLVREGFLVRKKGIGTFVMQPKYDALSFVTSHYPETLGEKHTVIKKTIIPAPDNVAESLCLEAGESVYELIRMRYFNEDPAAIVTAYLPVSKFPDFFQADLSQKIFTILFEKYDILISDFDTTLEPIILTQEEKSLFKLKLNKTAIGLSIERTCFDTSKQPFLITTTVFRSEYCRLIFSRRTN